MYNILATACIAAVFGYYMGKSSSYRTPYIKPQKPLSSPNDCTITSAKPTFANFSHDSHEFKQVLVVRTDLGMTKGKIAAQCAHASISCFQNLLKHCPDNLTSWLSSGQTKIALQAPNEQTLLDLQSTAQSLGLCAEIIHDAGRTQIPSGSATVLGIGPAPRNVVDAVTGHLRLL